MRKLMLGKSGVEVSALCLGGVWFGTKQDQTESEQLMDQYVDAGGSFIDTANIYAFWLDEKNTGGESETAVGKWMAARGNRADIFVATKMGFGYADVKQGLRAAQIVAECEKSLTRLQTDVIDLYYAHVDDRNTPYEETMAAFDQLIQAGKVRFVGASNYHGWRLAEAQMVATQNGWSPYVALQQRHTYLRPKPDASFGAQVVLDPPTSDYCASHDVRILAYTPTITGAYSGRADRPIPDEYDTPDTAARMTVLHEIAAEVGATPIQTVLAWMLHGAPQILPIIGGSTHAQLAENLGALDVKLTGEQMARLNEAGA